MTTKLDWTQVLTNTYDDDTNTLGIRGNVTAEFPPTQEIIINDTDDSVKIGAGGPGPYLDINSDGSINVKVVSGPSGITQNIASYSEISSVSSGIETTILTYTIPSGKTFQFNKCVVAGDNVARYTAAINTNPSGRRYTSYTNFTENFDFTSNGVAGPTLNAGDNVVITVLHNSSSLGNFNATLLGLLLG